VPARGAFGGLLYGVIAAPILIVAGIMISLTGWGIFLGVPVIVLGILAPLAGPLFGMGEHKGKCPACGTTVITVGDGKVHDCPTCSAKFAVSDHAAAGAR
jgi:DNA-directed RNA polymerase subunit RPC12/RpoP